MTHARDPRRAKMTTQLVVIFVKLQSTKSTDCVHGLRPGLHQCQ